MKTTLAILSIILLLASAYIAYTLWFKPIQADSTSVTSVINEIEKNNVEEIPDLDTKEITDDSNKQTSDKKESNKKAVQDTIDSINKDESGIDSTTDFADFGNIE